MRTQSSPIILSELGPATGLFILGVRSYAFGTDACCCIKSGYQCALGGDSEETLANILLWTRLVGHNAPRRLSLCAPGCMRTTYDEMAMIKALFMAQAWDVAGLASSLKELIGEGAPTGVTDLTVAIADSFAGHGLAFIEPDSKKLFESQAV